MGHRMKPLNKHEAFPETFQVCGDLEQHTTPSYTHTHVLLVLLFYFSCTCLCRRPPHVHGKIAD